MQSNIIQNPAKMQPKGSQNVVKMQPKFSKTVVKMQSKCSSISVSSWFAHRLKSFQFCLIFNSFFRQEKRHQRYRRYISTQPTLYTNQNPESFGRRHGLQIENFERFRREFGRF